MQSSLRLGLTGAVSTLAVLALVISADEAGADAENFEPLVSIMELMERTITPATDQLWSAWEEPSTPAEWQKMEEAAVTLLAAISLTETGGTGPMDSDWVNEPAWKEYNQAMIVAGKAALAASQDKNLDALLAAGDLLLDPCEECHQQFNPAVIDEQ